MRLEMRPGGSFEIETVDGSAVDVVVTEVEDGWIVECWDLTDDGRAVPMRPMLFREHEALRGYVRDLVQVVEGKDDGDECDDDDG